MHCSRFSPAIASLTVAICLLFAPGCTTPATPAPLGEMAKLEQTKKRLIAQAVADAQHAERQEDFSSAVAHYDRALRIEPNNSLVIVARGRAQFQLAQIEREDMTVLDRYVETVTISREAVIAEYENWMHMARTALAMHDFNAAGEYVQQAINSLEEHAELFNPDAHTDKMRKLQLLDDQIRAGRKSATSHQANQFVDVQ